MIDLDEDKTDRQLDNANGTKASLMARQTDEWTDGETRGQTDRHMGRQGRWVDRHMDGQLHKQAGLKTDRD